MRKALPWIVAVAMVVVGGMWTMQGLGYLEGSPMTGAPFWAIAGPAPRKNAVTRSASFVSSNRLDTNSLPFGPFSCRPSSIISEPRRNAAIHGPCAAGHEARTL